MPIEFRCESCQHLLRTGDDTAGKKARCPQCGNIQQVPANQPVSSSSSDYPTVPDTNSPFADSQAHQAKLQNPFAADTQTNPYASSHVPQAVLPTPEAAKAKLLPPAICLIVVCGLALMLWLLVVGVGVAAVIDEGMDEDDAMAFGMFGVSILFCGLIIIGSIQMIRLRMYGLVMTAAIAAVIPCSCQWVLTVPFGIWALIVLMSENVRSQFA